MISSRIMGAFLLTQLLMQSQTAAPDPPQQSEATFGVTVVDSAGLQGQVYLLREGTEKLPDFTSMKPVGTIYTASLNIPPQRWLRAFPGVTNRFEWFAIDYHGNFWLPASGIYRFALQSDDGSRLWIDDQLVIDSDGIHPAVTRFGSLLLSPGVHHIRVAYFQGPRDMLALVLMFAGPGEKLRLFSTSELKPPSNPDDWPDKPRPDSQPAAPASAPSVAAGLPAGPTSQLFRLPRGSVRLLSVNQIAPAGSFSSDTASLPSKQVFDRFFGPHGAGQPFALSFAADFWVGQAGIYQFSLRAEDGGMLAIDGQLVTDNDQPHHILDVTRYASLKLCPGTHRIQLRMFHFSQADIELKLEIARPGGKFHLFRLQDFALPTNTFANPAAAQAATQPASCN
jgi:hypothetical protein